MSVSLDTLGRSGRLAPEPLVAPTQQNDTTRRVDRTAGFVLMGLGVVISTASVALPMLGYIQGEAGGLILLGGIFAGAFITVGGFSKAILRGPFCCCSCSSTYSDIQNGDPGMTV
ncbi:MAG: hypothetical protein JSS12_08575 [Verrucomicrobia bacterium]|nr:hypothetical protein [Verrucomicrobiota bacterium]